MIVKIEDREGSDPFFNLIIGSSGKLKYHHVVPVIFASP